VVSAEEEKERLQWEGFAEKEGFIFLEYTVLVHCWLGDGKGIHLYQ